MQPMSDVALAEISCYFRVLAEPTRLKILQVLCTGEKNVTQIIVETGGDPANISQQLRTLGSVGILSRRPVGTSVIYAIQDPTVFKLCETVYKHLVIQMEHRMRIRNSLLEPQHITVSVQA